nr:MAG TPA: hypothetical protein [Caudoviricetes sp.]
MRNLTRKLANVTFHGKYKEVFERSAASRAHTRIGI